MAELPGAKQAQMDIIKFSQKSKNYKFFSVGLLNLKCINPKSPLNDYVCCPRKYESGATTHAPIAAPVPAPVPALSPTPGNVNCRALNNTHE